jgi:hypothetical protein
MKANLASGGPFDGNMGELLREACGNPNIEGFAQDEIGDILDKSFKMGSKLVVTKDYECFSVKNEFDCEDYIASSSYFIVETYEEIKLYLCKD